MVNLNITLYTASSSNGHKITIILVLLNINYTVKVINLANNEQKEKWYLKINPNGRIPAILDHSNGDFSVFESGSILLYLVKRYDTEIKLWPEGFKLQSELIQWLIFQMSGIGPMMGQAAHFGIYAPKRIQYVLDRYINESKRFFSVLETKLEDNNYIAANQLKIADLALFLWISLVYRLAIDLLDYPNLSNRVQRLAKIPEVVKRLDVPEHDQFRLVGKDPRKLKEELERYIPDFYSTK